MDDPSRCKPDRYKDWYKLGQPEHHLVVSNKIWLISGWVSIQCHESRKTFHWKLKVKTFIYLIDVDVFRILRYWRISGTVIKRRALRNRSPRKSDVIFWHFWAQIYNDVGNPKYSWYAEEPPSKFYLLSTQRYQLNCNQWN